MAATEKKWLIREDGCISIDVNITQVTYNTSLNGIILSSRDQTVTVIDALSGVVLQKSDLSGHKNEAIKCIYLPEKEKTIFCDSCAVGVRGDQQGILLLDTALQTSVVKTEEPVKIELPLVEATHLLKTCIATDLSGKEYADEFIRDLTHGIQQAQDATQGNHKTAKWATVCLEMQHLALKSFCSTLIEELTKTNQTGQGFPVASAIIDRLGFLLPSSRSDILKEPLNRALMYSEAARLETFANWPHMNYKWALPEPMAQAGFFHHPNLSGDDRAMCFTCNVCLVCWEPTDEPWSEHERHSPLCPYIKGDYTQNVPLTATYATQPAQVHGFSDEKIACISTTFNEDFIATSTREGNIVVWDSSHLLKKHCQFNIDMTDALVALKTGLQIERSERTSHGQVTKKHSEEVNEISLHEAPSSEGSHPPHSSQRPCDDMHVTALCVADETKWQEEATSLNPRSSSTSDAQLSLICGVSLRRTKPQAEESKSQTGLSGSISSNRTVQLMNEVNETVSSESTSRLITDKNKAATADAVLSESQLAPYIIVVSLVEDVQAVGQASPVKKKTPSQTAKPTNHKEHSVSLGAKPAESTDDWMLNQVDLSDPDPDCQIVGFTPAPQKNSNPFTGTFSTSSDESKHIKDIGKSSVPNGPSDLFCDTFMVDSAMLTPLKPFSFSFATNTSDSSSNSTVTVNGSPKKDVPTISGNVIQCIELPSQFQKEHIRISSILPSVNKQHVIVVLSTKVSFMESSSVVDSTVQTDCCTSDILSATGDSYCGGGVLVYRMKNDILEDTPLVQYVITSPKDVVTSTLLLPLEVEDQVEEKSTAQAFGNNSLPGSVVGHMVVTTASGSLKILALSTLNVIAEISPSKDTKFLSMTYCSGIERLCVCTDNGKLHFFDIDALGDREKLSNSVDCTDGAEMNGDATSKRAKLDEDVADHTGLDFHTNQPLSPETLTEMHSLTQFENLMPRFTAVVPPCWSEIQQEQQQRRHPQHLQQQGEATQHTRTWKLAADAGQTWDEHLLEILLPKPCSVGHVDVKFSLHPLCTLQPNIEVTLLKQNIGSMHRPVPSPPASAACSTQSDQASSKPEKDSPGNESDSSTEVNNVLDPKFLDSHNAEILCGPIKLADCLDLTLTGGLITLASPQLLNSKPRSLLLHIKGFENSPLVEPILANKDRADAERSSVEKMIQKSRGKAFAAIYKNVMVEKLEKHKNTIKGLFDSVTQAFSDKAAAPNSSSKQKTSSLKGCDWFLELSVTVRVFKKSNVRNEKQQRNAMIQDSAFHKRLIKLLVSPPSESSVMTVSSEHLQNMALDILIWILGVQMHDISKRPGKKAILEAIQEHLKGVVTSSFIGGSRTTAHKCSRLIILCMECCKLFLVPDLAPSFTQSVLQALLSCFPILPLCKSSGAMRWFFSILNRVKCMDTELVAEKTSRLLHDVATQYASRTLPLQALLKTRYGLYGNPFEAELFDMELTGITKPSGGSSGVSSSVFSKLLKNVNSTSNSSSNGKEQNSFFDLLTSPEKVSKLQPDCLRNDILGLLEVEPLHFRCHATSDGTRMERLDATSNVGGIGSMSSAFMPTPAPLVSLQPVANDDSIPMPSGGELSSLFQPPSPCTFGKLSNPLMPLLDDSVLKVKKTISGNMSKMYGAKVFHLMQQQHQQAQNEQVLGSKVMPQKTGTPKQFAIPPMQGLLQTPPPQVLVIERMHSGARRFVTLDFGKPIVLTDVIIPSSIDLASLSIDVWVEGEEIDGQRLVVASDINNRTLVMNNIMPAPVCRYLKITTVGRYSGGTTRSRIPLGSFYGHTYILPWEWTVSGMSNPSSKSQTSSHSSKASPPASSSSASTSEDIEACAVNEEMGRQASVLSQLGMFSSLLEDLQCRFNLARTRLESLLSSSLNAQVLSGHVQYHLKKNSMGKINDEDGHIIQAYSECLQLQLQQNLAQRAICRLQTALGISSDPIDLSVEPKPLLELASTDKLRVIMENLLDVLLTSTIGSPAIPQPPLSLYHALTPERSQMLFECLCLHGTQRIQVAAGLLLVRVSGTQAWWGDFMGKMLQQFFHSQYSDVFPQDRVFVLLSALGQKSLSGPSAQSILDSLLVMLTSILEPLMGNVNQTTTGNSEAVRYLDLSLISWVLLFLCRNMDSSATPVVSNAEDSEKGAKKDKEMYSINNRWSFIESHWSGSGVGSSSGARGKSQGSFGRGFQRKMAFYWKLPEIEKLKAAYGNSDKKSKTSAKQLVKDAIDLHQLQRGAGPTRLDAKDDERENDPCLVLSRERCLSVVRHLMVLLLSMDFTCHVDLFMIACKVLAKICLSCRPSITLAEVMTQDQLEKLVLLVVGSEFNHDSLSWGGPWASHVITCLLQDVLEGEKTCLLSPSESEVEPVDVDDSVLYNQWLEKEGILTSNESGKGGLKGRMIMQTEQAERCLRSKPEFFKFLERDFFRGNICLDEKDDPAAVVNLFANKKDKGHWNLFLDMVTKHQAQASDQSCSPSSPAELPDFIMEANVSSYMTALEKKLAEEIQLSDSSSGSSGSQQTSSSSSGSSVDITKIAQLGQHTGSLKKLLHLKNKLTEHFSVSAMPVISQGLSTAVDARLEIGLETMPEHRLKVIQSVQMSSIQSAFASPLPHPPAGLVDFQFNPPSMTDDQETQFGLSRETERNSSMEMLSQCFEGLFAQLNTGRVSLENVLQLWLTLNEDQPTSESSASARGTKSTSVTSNFDFTRQPSIVLSEKAVASLMEVVVMSPCLPIRVWVYVIQALCLLTNQQQTNMDGVEVSLAPYILNDGSLAALLTKFLSCHSQGGSLQGGQQFQVGPTVVKLFGDLLFRLHCKSFKVNLQNFKEMLLKIVYHLTAERGAIYQSMGPIDAQVKFVRMVLENALPAVDISNALSVIQAASTLVYQYLSCEDQVKCHTSQDTGQGAKSCFGGLVASLLRGNDNQLGGADSLREDLMYILMQLVNDMISTVSSANARGTASSLKSSNSEAMSNPWEARMPSPNSRKQAWPDPPIGGQVTSSSRCSPRHISSVRLSDDEKYRNMGQQQLEQVRLSSDEENTSEEETIDMGNTSKTSEIADIVVGNPVIMQNLIQSLSYCSSNKLALVFSYTDILNSLEENADLTEALTVGDLIFNILKNLSKLSSDRCAMVENLFRFFVGHPPLMNHVALTRLSEPLLFFTLRTLCSYSSIKKFIDLGGINIVSTNFVRCSRQMISSTPSIISTLMQNFGSGHGDLTDKTKTFESDNTEGLQNFAHLGSIVSSSPTASPANGLIQAMANRRARSATWSYHFHQDETSVALTIHLPFAILLKYVHIRPHGGAIASCPSQVSLELSHDGNMGSPASPLLVTSSLSLIRLQLQKPEVVTAVKLLLHRPRDSVTIGLQNISLWGQSAFSESTDQSVSLLNEECFSRSSLGWMRILHHCLVASTKDVQSIVAHTAASIPDLLTTCTCLLVHPQIGVHAPKIETILIKIGLCSNEMGLALLDCILDSTASGSQSSYLGKIGGTASPYTVEILYKLGITQDENTQSRVEAMLKWLRMCALNHELFQQRQQQWTRRGIHLATEANSPSPEHVQCVAAILWHSAELMVAYPFREIVTDEFVRAMYNWSISLSDSNLRKAVNYVLCASCHVFHNGFILIQEWMGIVDANTSQVLAPGDENLSLDRVENPASTTPQGRMTDDSKVSTPTVFRSQDGMTDDSKEACRLQNLSSMNLDENKLMLLATTCKSPVAIRQLMNCGLPTVLAQAVCEFCNQHIMMAVAFTSAQHSDGEDNGPHRNFPFSFEENGRAITPSLVSAILRFFTEICSEVELKDWLGQGDGNIFWSFLLTLLCGSQFRIPVIGLAGAEFHGLTAEERSEIETRTIQFFSAVTSFHSKNQLLFAKVLCEVIKDQGRRKTELLSAMPLSGFMRRLLLQVLLEDEKITVAVSSGCNSIVSATNEFYSSEATENFPLTTANGQIHHPRFGSGRSCQCVTMNLNAKCSDVVGKVADTLPIMNNWPEKKEEKRKRWEEGKKESLGELDMDIMDLISEAAGSSAKEKREKSPLAKTGLPPRPPTRRGRQNSGLDSLLDSASGLRIPHSLFHRAKLQHPSLPGKDLPLNLTLSQLLQVLHEYALTPQTTALQFDVRFRGPGVLRDGTDSSMASDETLLSSQPFPSALKVFASEGGLALLAEHLPLLFPEISRQGGNVEVVSDSNPTEIGQDWVTVESSDELYDPYLEPSTPPHNSKGSKQAMMGLMLSVPPHSLIAFGLFLRLPGYAEVLLKERKTAQYLLRLVLGVTDDGDGGQILTSPVASSLPTMPFTVLKTLFDSSPLTTDDGVWLRRMALEIGVVHLVLACLSTLSHHKPKAPLTSFQHETQLILSAMQSSATMGSLSQPEEKAQQYYWAKGTGFGTGSTTSSWDAEQAMLRQKGEEEHVACLFQVLASYMNPNNSLDTKSSSSSLAMDYDLNPLYPPPGEMHSSKNLIPESLTALLSQSCLIPALSSYLRNDSVLDMARHVPLYRALLQLLRGITVTPSLVPILLPYQDEKKTSGDSETGGDVHTSIEALLEKMKCCVDTYASRLKSNKGKSGNKMEDEESEGLALLIPDIQETACLVRAATQQLKKVAESKQKGKLSAQGADRSKSLKSLEDQYITSMKELQFDTYELVSEEGRNLKFNVPYHYEANAKATGTVTNIARTRRLAQEAVTLSTSLPLAFSSTVFVRCDEERLDIMKVLITGPSDTPYANGCFEFDVFFPQDYPNTPPFINMETTGNHSVRFNPNLYNDGKVCLSVLNTWHGRPEEKWNAQTSSFLQVLVSIQSLILVSEPYFNEPGYERSRGTPSGAASSHEYDANIRQATVKWAMLEQLKNPSACFKDVIHTHFWLKRHEILQQCEKWIGEMETYSSDKRTGRSIAQSNLALKRHYNQLREELSRLKPPSDMESEEDPEATPIDPEAKQYATSAPVTEALAGPSTGEDSSAALFPSINSPVMVNPHSNAIITKKEVYVDGKDNSPFTLPENSTAGGGDLMNSFPPSEGQDEPQVSMAISSFFMYDDDLNDLNDLLDPADPDC